MLPLALAVAHVGRIHGDVGLHGRVAQHDTAQVVIVADTTKYEIAPRKHAELILTMVDELLSKSTLSLTQLDALAFGRGPGAFTGVRIATGVIQGLAMSADCPVVPVSTLAALAQGAISESKQVACAIDARMEEVYWGLYQADDKNIMQLVGEESVCPPDSINIPKSANWFGVGSGWETYEQELQDRIWRRQV